MNARQVYWWLYLTALADIATTAVGIEVFGLVESTAIPALVMGAFGGPWAAVPLKAGIVGLVYYEWLWMREQPQRHINQLGAALVAIIGGMSLLAATWNVWLML